MALHFDRNVKLKFGQMPSQICAALPWQVSLTAHRIVDGVEEEEPAPLSGDVVVRAIKAHVALEENFANCALGKWKVTCETHYEFGFDERVSATGHPSMFLKGGNDSNFGMVMTVQPSKSVGGFEDDSEPEDPNLDAFQPARVTFYVRTDSPNADAGHFILGESNEVNRRVAQFQFTREGKMGLLGSGGASYGSVPYKPLEWYRIDLTFDWAKKEVNFYVNCKLEEQGIPFRRSASNYIGACALGNRDRCTTWFDSFSFTSEEEVSFSRLPLVDGRATGWCSPVGRESELWLQATIEPSEREPRRSPAAILGPDARRKAAVNPSAGSSAAAVAAAAAEEVTCLSQALGTFARFGPFTPVSGREVAQRHALNEIALNDMRSMLGDEATADVLFKVDGVSLLAHRCVLSARCETFRAMLSSQLAEGRPAKPLAHCAEASDAPVAGASLHMPAASDEQQRPRPVWTVAIHETRPAVFAKMLEFLYAGAIEVEAEMATELLALADQYMLRGLAQICGFSLRNSISVDSVCRILQAADRFDFEGSELKQQCLDFILANYKQVVESPTYDELANSAHLLVQISRAISSPPAHNTRKRAREALHGA